MVSKIVPDEFITTLSQKLASIKARASTVKLAESSNLNDFMKDLLKLANDIKAIAPNDETKPIVMTGEMFVIRNRVRLRSLLEHLAHNKKPAEHCILSIVCGAFLIGRACGMCGISDAAIAALESARASGDGAKGADARRAKMAAWQIPALELAKELRATNPCLSQEELAGKIAGSGGVVVSAGRLVLAIRAWERAGKLKRRSCG